jgi:hypothetical protein
MIRDPEYARPDDRTDPDRTGLGDTDPLPSGWLPTSIPDAPAGRLAFGGFVVLRPHIFHRACLTNETLQFKQRKRR